MLVIGRDFSYALVRAVAGIDDAALQTILDRLAEADILLVQGLPPQSEYRSAGRESEPVTVTALGFLSFRPFWLWISTPKSRMHRKRKPVSSVRSPSRASNKPNPGNSAPP